MDTLVFGHKSPDTDSTGSAILWAWYLTQIKKLSATAKLLGEPNNEAAFVLDFWGISKPAVISTLERNTPVVIVDTNNPDELPENINDCRILEIIDHHKWVGGLTTKEIANVTVRPLGCTATLMIELMGKTAVDQMPRALKGLALSCILSDTIAFRSPTTTAQDRNVAEKLLADLCIDMADYANQMFAAKSDVSEISDQRLLTLDCKDYVIAGKKYRLAMLETQTPEALLNRREGIKAAINAFTASMDIDQMLVFIVDIVKEEAILLLQDAQAKKLAECAFGEAPKDDTMVLPGVLSRKKQIVPALHRVHEKGFERAA